MLGQSSEVGVGTRIDIAGPVDDPLRDVIVPPGPPKIVKEIRYCFSQRNPICDPICCSSERHGMLSLRRQEVTQLGVILVILELRKDPL